MPKKKGLKMNLQFFAEKNPPVDPTPEGGNDPEPPKPGGSNDTFTREYVESLRAENAKHRTKLKDMEKQVQNGATETMQKVLEALGLEPDANKNYENQINEWKQKAQEADQRANQKLIAGESKLVAAELGVKPEKVQYLTKLADLSDVSVDEEGNVDANAIKSKFEAILQDNPEWKAGAQTTPPKGGSDINTGGTNEPQKPKNLRDALSSFYKRG